MNPKLIKNINIKVKLNILLKKKNLPLNQLHKCQLEKLDQKLCKKQN
jgi:hypothetical protein